MHTRSIRSRARLPGRAARLGAIVAALLAAPCIGRAASDQPQALHYTTPSGVRIEVTAAGLRDVRYKDEQVAKGQWRAVRPDLIMDTKQAPGPQLDDVKARSITVKNDQAARVVHQHADVTVTYDYRFEGEDVTITARVENPTNKDVPGVAFTGLSVTTKKDPTHSATVGGHAIRRQGTEVCYPSIARPIGGAYAVGDPISIGAAPITRGIQRSLVRWDGSRTQGQPALKPVYIRPQPVWSNGARQYKLRLRFSPNSDWRHLLEPYRAFFRETFGGVRYTPDDRPVVMVHHRSAANHVGGGNPYGFTDKKRRFDRDENIQRFTQQTLPALKRAGVAAVIFRGMAGHDPRGLDYRPTWWMLPPEIDLRLPQFVEPMNQAGVRLGVFGQPNVWGVRKDWHTSKTLPVSPDTRGHVARMTRRFDAWQQRGAKAYFFTRFGAGADDVRLLRQYREHLGPDVRIYTGQASDLSLLYAMGGVELAQGRGEKQPSFVLSERQRAILRWLVPDAPLAAHPNERTMSKQSPEDWLERVRQAQLVPMVPDKTFAKVNESIARWPKQRIVVREPKQSEDKSKDKQSQ